MKLFEIYTTRSGQDLFVSEKDSIGFKCRHIGSKEMTRAKEPKRGWVLKTDKYSTLADDILKDIESAMISVKKPSAGLRCFDSVREKYKGCGRIRFSSGSGWWNGSYAFSLKLKNGQEIYLCFTRQNNLEIMNSSLK